MSTEKSTQRTLFFSFFFVVVSLYWFRAAEAKSSSSNSDIPKVKEDETLLVEHLLLNHTKFIKLLQMRISHERTENVSGIVYHIPPLATVDKSRSSLQGMQCFPSFNSKLNTTESVAIIPMMVKLWSTEYLETIKTQLKQIVKNDSLKKNKQQQLIEEEISVLPMPAVSIEVVPTSERFPFNHMETSLQYKNALPQFNDFPSPNLEFALIIKSATPDPVAQCKFLSNESNKQMFLTNWLLNNLKIKYNIQKSWLSKKIMENLFDNITNVYEPEVSSSSSTDNNDNDFNVTLEKLTLKDLTDSSPWHRYVSKNIDMRYVSVSYIDAWVHYMAQKAISLGCQSQDASRLCNLRASKINELEAKIKNLVCEKELKLPYMVRRHFYKYIFPNSYAIMKQETYCTVDLLSSLHTKLQQVTMRVAAEDMAHSGSQDKKQNSVDNSIVSFYFPITVDDTTSA